MKLIIDKIKALIREKEIVAKTICVLLAFAAWAYVVNTKIGSISFEIPIEIKNLPDELIISSISKKSVSVELNGKKEYLKNVKNIRALVDLQRARIGKRKYIIKLQKQQIPESINITLSFKFVEMVIEKKFVQKVKVLPKISGSLPDSYIMGIPIITPESIYVSGPRSVTRKIKSIYTDDINISNETNHIVKEVEIDTDEYQNITLSESNIKIYVPIYAKKDLYSLEIPVIIKNAKNEYNYSLSHKKVRVYIKPSARDQVITENTFAVTLFMKSIDVFLDVSTIELQKTVNNSTSYDEFLPVNVVNQKSLGNYEIITIEPEKINVTITRK